MFYYSNILNTQPLPCSYVTQIVTFGCVWQDVKPIPDSTYNAVEAAYKKYIAYLDSFEEDEAYIKKKVENELGGLFLQIKQRLSGLDPKWSKVRIYFPTM